MRDSSSLSLCVGGESHRWCVYLLALTDCSAFKIGFSCNLLQRLYSFSHRYFERFATNPGCVLPPRPDGDDGQSWNMFAVLLPLDRLRITQIGNDRLGIVVAQIAHRKKTHRGQPPIRFDAPAVT